MGTLIVFAANMKEGKDKQSKNKQKIRFLIEFIRTSSMMCNCIFYVILEKESMQKNAQYLFLLTGKYHFNTIRISLTDTHHNKPTIH